MINHSKLLMINSIFNDNEFEITPVIFKFIYERNNREIIYI